MDVYTLSNAGAYGEHGPTTVGLAGHKSIPLYSAACEALPLLPTMWSTPTPWLPGAYRGYGATQGIFAVEIGRQRAGGSSWAWTPSMLREKNMVRGGPASCPPTTTSRAGSCALDRCMARAKEMIGWDEKYPSAGAWATARSAAVGVAMAMQGSGISGVDVACVPRSS